MPEPAPAAEECAPQTDIKIDLAGLWQDVMKRERVGVNDSFLSLGGDSMLAVQLLTRVRGALGVELSMIEFFAAPTVVARRPAPR